jgi:hypothetical protein
MLLVRLLALVALFAFVTWLCVDPGFEPGIGVITSFSALIGLWLNERQSRQKASQKQTVATGAVAVQAGGDVQVGSIQNGSTTDAK